MSKLLLGESRRVAAAEQPLIPEPKMATLMRSLFFAERARDVVLRIMVMKIVVISRSAVVANDDGMSLANASVQCPRCCIDVLDGPVNGTVMPRFNVMPSNIMNESLKCEVVFFPSSPSLSFIRQNFCRILHFSSALWHFSSAGID